MGIFHSKQRHNEGQVESARGPRQKGEVTEADKAVLSLKTQRRKLAAERQRLEGLITEGVAEAKRCIQQMRTERALLTLRKNKLYKQTLDKIDAYLLNVEQVLANIEAAQRNNRLFSALKEGNSTLADLQKQVSLEDVEILNEETAEIQGYQERLRGLLGEALSAEDDAAALEELERIQAEEEAEAAARMPRVPVSLQQHSEEDLRFPSVPQHKIQGASAEQQRQANKPVFA